MHRRRLPALAVAAFIALAPAAPADADTLTAPDPVTGACPAGSTPVYELWNGRPDSHRRSTTDRATRDAMVANGYRSEGFGPLGVVACSTPVPPLAAPLSTVTGVSPFAVGCDGVPATGVVYTGAEVEPYVAIDPLSASHVIGVWQQDRWSDGGARGIRTGYSFDGGATWSLAQAAFSRCTGGNAGNGGDYARASDPWVAIGPDGIGYQIAIAFNGASFAPGSVSAVLASRSIDGGRTWSDPATLIRDATAPFNDKESITADPLAPGYAYAAWDRLEQNGHGPAYFARTTNGGVTWEAARAIYDPGGRSQTLNNQIVVAKGGSVVGTLYDFFSEFRVLNNLIIPRLAFVRSTDRGVTWSAPAVVSDLQSLGTHDPQNPALQLRDGANIASFASGPSGVLVGAWQDSRFSGGVRDGIAFSRSTDGGNTWTAPVQINAFPTVQALLPTVAVRDDGTVGVLYYDMRDDTPDRTTILVDAWLATSGDGVHWSERHVAGPFDFARAPVAEGGLFIGDYQGLASAGGVFVAFFAKTTSDATNRTDIYASALSAAVAQAAEAGKAHRAIEAAPVPATPTRQEDLQRSVRRTIAQRLIGRPAGEVQPGGIPP